MAAARSLRMTPVQQVLQMLGEMKSKGLIAMEAEKKTFDSYAEWVDDRVTNLGFEITTTKSTIEQLIAFIDKADSDAASLGLAVSSLDQEIGTTESEQKAETEQREKENAEYEKVQQDYAESVDALERAIQTLKSQNYDRPQADALLQKMAGQTSAMRRVLAAYLEESDSSDGAPAVAAYEFQSQGIVAVLEKLLDKFKAQLSETESGEANAAHAYDLKMLHLGNMAERLNSDRSDKAALKGKTLSESSAAKGRLGAAKADLAEDTSLLAETKATFAAKKRAFEANQKIREEELAALAEAIGIISDSSVAGKYTTHVKLTQVASKSRSPTLLQESSQSSSARAQVQRQAIAFLKSKAEALRSSILTRAASTIAENPFGKVIEMIEGLLAKLKEEAAAEADHKSFCDEELQKNKLKREETDAHAAQLQAEVEKYAAEIQEMADEIKVLSEEQASLAQTMSESTAAREKEKAENEAAIKDAVEAQAALKKAIVILREFYSKQASPEVSASFLQRKKKQVPELAVYKGLQGAKGGVIGMLEVIESDFLRLETETKAAEAKAASEYKSFMSKSKAVAKKNHDREFKTSLSKDQAEFEV